MNLAQCSAISELEYLEDARFEMRFFLYITKFSHEFDWINDNHEERKLRAKGVNPKSEDYQHMIDNYRSQFGLESLNECGLPQSKNAWLVCDQGAKDILEYDEKVNKLNKILANESRHIFESQCRCIMNGEMQKVPDEIDSAIAIEYYQSNCNCGLLIKEN